MTPDAVAKIVEMLDRASRWDRDAPFARRDLPSASPEWRNVTMPLEQLVRFRNSHASLLAFAAVVLVVDPREVAPIHMIAYMSKLRNYLTTLEEGTR